MPGQLSLPPSTFPSTAQCILSAPSPQGVTCVLSSPHNHTYMWNKACITAKCTCTYMCECGECVVCMCWHRHRVHACIFASTQQIYTHHICKAHNHRHLSPPFCISPPLSILILPEFMRLYQISSNADIWSQHLDQISL